jgi:hypothetical protein
MYARAMQRAKQALLLDPDQATAHYTKARLIIFTTKPNNAASADEIIAEAEASLSADPSFAGGPLGDGQRGNVGCTRSSRALSTCRRVSMKR